MVILKGEFHYAFYGSPRHKGREGEILFIPAGTRFFYQTFEETELMVFRIYSTIDLSEHLSFEELDNARKEVREGQKKTEEEPPLYLKVKPGLQLFLESIANNIADEICCDCYFELKIRELLLLFNAYYAKEEIIDFFHLVLSSDITFSEYVRLNWDKFDTVGELADSMHLTHRQFALKFKNVFGKTPYKWMLETKARILFKELSGTSKPFKEISVENGFSTVAQFSKFCKKELGHTPTEIRFRRKLKSEKIAKTM